jgi:hypothetical protein
VENGRPSKLTQEVHTRIVAAIQRGSYVETAAQLAGINKVTYYDWLKRGQAVQAMLDEAHEDEQPDISTHDANCANFSNAVFRAMAEAEVRDVTAIDNAAQQGTWQAAAWKLERKHHSRWGRKVAVTDEQGGNFFDGMAKAWANALAADVNELPTIEGESVEVIGRTNGSGS